MTWQENYAVRPVQDYDAHYGVSNYHNPLNPGGFDEPDDQADGFKLDEEPVTSAYGDALAAGFVGSLADWLELNRNAVRSAGSSEEF